MDAFYSFSGPITVGQVSGLIALGASVVTLTLPLLTTVLLVHYYNKEITAASASVLAKELHSTLWPTIMRSDSAGMKNVNWRIHTVASINTLAACLLFITGIITPLGLGDNIAATTPKSAKFVYVPDHSDFGNGTMHRPARPLSRDCLAESGYFCPGTVISGAGVNATSSSAIPDNVTTMFTSASRNSTVAGLFDIEYRSWVTTTSSILDSGKPYTRGQECNVDTLLSSTTGLILREGIIADMSAGGLGFRNHSAPTDAPYGASWDEDVLWLEPDISCTSNNLSVHVELVETKSLNSTLHALLVDDGGFANLGAVNVVKGWPVLNYSQPDVKLLSRRSAEMHNVLAAMVLNLTTASDAKYGINVTAGASYPIIRGSFSPNSHLEFQTFYFDGSYIAEFDDVVYENGSLSINGSVVANPNRYPQELGSSLFMQASSWCEGRFNSDLFPTSQYNVICGQMFGAPERTDDGQPLYQEPGSKWKMPVHTCAGAVKASIKTVSFLSNGTSSLQHLTATASKEKAYGDGTEYPVWAYEDFGKHLQDSNVTNGSTVPLWGVVDGAYRGTPGYNFVQSPYFYLPQTYEFSYGTTGAPFDMSAGAVAPQGILRTAMYGVNSINSGSGSRYTGSQSVALLNKWRLLFERQDGPVTALRIIWTDLMANAVLGTNRGFTPSGPNGSALDSAAQRTMTPFTKRIVYDMRYAIPAIVALAVWVALLLGALVMGFTRHRIFLQLSHMLNDTCVGRVATNQVSPEKSLSRASTKVWQKDLGKLPIILGDSTALKADQQACLGNVDVHAGTTIESIPMLAKGNEPK